MVALGQEPDPGHAGGGIWTMIFFAELARIFRYVSLLAVAIFLSSSTQLLAGEVITGAVLDSSGTPIARATVSLEGTPTTAVTAGVGNIL